MEIHRKLDKGNENKYNHFIIYMYKILKNKEKL